MVSQTEVLRAERLADDERMQGQRHHPAAVLGVSPQYVVLVLDHLEEVGAGEAAEEQTS